MGVTETENAYRNGRLTNYKKLRQKYLYQYVTGISTAQAKPNGSESRTDRYEHNKIEKKDKTQQVDTEKETTLETTDKENKALDTKPGTINISLQTSVKNTITCPICLINPDRMCDHCKNKLSRDERATVLQSDKLKHLRKLETDDATIPNSRKNSITTSTTSDTSKRKAIKYKTEPLPQENKVANKCITKPNNQKNKLSKDKNKPDQENETINIKELQCDKEKQESAKERSNLDEEQKKPDQENKNEKQDQEKENRTPHLDDMTPEDKNKLHKKISKKELEKLLKIQAEALETEKLLRGNHRTANQDESTLYASAIESNTDVSIKTSTVLSCGVVDKTEEIIIGENIVKRHIKPTQSFVPVVEKEEIIKEHKYKNVSDNDKPLESQWGILYALSDRRFINNGWTILPHEKIMRKTNVYRMYPSQPEFDWFEQNKWRGLVTYDSGDKLAEFEEKNRCRIFYKNGRIALDYYTAETLNVKQRLVVYSNRELDESGRAHPVTVLAIFDYLGNGIVFDHGGKVRLKYNQTEGAVLDSSIGPLSTWQWHKLNDPPDLQSIMIDNYLSPKDPVILKLAAPHREAPRQKDEEMEAIILDNYAKEKAKKLTQNYKPFQIKMKALKINENFSLKILDQATIYLIFREGIVHIKLNIGMKLDDRKIVDTDIAEVGIVSNDVERITTATDSVTELRKTIQRARQYARSRSVRERLVPLTPAESTY